MTVTYFSPNEETPCSWTTVAISRGNPDEDEDD
jgi:hypothetical protein